MNIDLIMFTKWKVYGQIYNGKTFFHLFIWMLNIYPIQSTSSHANSFQTQPARQRSVASRWDRTKRPSSGGSSVRSGNLSLLSNQQILCKMYSAMESIYKSNSVVLTCLFSPFRVFFEFLSSTCGWIVLLKIPILLKTDINTHS